MATGLGTEIQWYSPTVGGGSYNADDQSGNGNHGTFSRISPGGASVQVIADTGAGGTHAFRFFNSNGNMISVPSHVDGSLNTLSWWSNLTSVNGNRCMVQDGTNSSTSTGAGGIFVRTTSGKVTIYCGNGVWQTLNFGGTATVSTNTWFHTVVQQDGTNTEIWIDGVLKGTSVSTDNPWASNGGNTGIASIGSDGRSGTGTTIGVNKWMDDIRWHDRILTATEIAYLATARGVLGSPGGTPEFYNPFSNKRFNQDYNSRIR